MASKLIGRCECPECNFHAAHVKVKDEEGKRAYRHCPECGAQYFTRSQGQDDALRAKIRQEQAAPAPAPAPAKPAAPEVPPPVPAQSFKMVLGVRVPA